jgi:Chlorophyll A-B binding protein
MAAMTSRIALPAALRAPGVSSAPKRAARAVVPRASAGKEWMLQQPGITAPLGFFDPAGLCDSPTMSVSEAKRFREAELTHGRVAMLATLGWFVAEEFHPFFGTRCRVCWACGTQLARVCAPLVLVSRKAP